ncbi:hypothetical protein N9036_02175 [Akkermansiaceae bacterium]|nr:hypothetical protein [Akkermansiaceae bacterium]
MVERLEVAGTAAHEQEDYVLRPWTNVGAHRGQHALLIFGE